MNGGFSTFSTLSFGIIGLKAGLHRKGLKNLLAVVDSTSTGFSVVLEISVEVVFGVSVEELCRNEFCLYDIFLYLKQLSNT